MTTTLSRRTILLGGAAAATPLVLPMFGRTGKALGAAPPDPASGSRNRLVVIYLQGANDGLNTVVPVADADGTQRRSVYEQVRPTLKYATSALLPLDRSDDAGRRMGVNPKLAYVHSLYRTGRVAIVQGVDYPQHDYSHFASTDIWQSGLPGNANGSGWLGRHLDRAGIGAGELRGLAISNSPPLILAGKVERGVSIRSIPLSYYDGTAPFAGARHSALDGFAAYPATEPLRRSAGRNAQLTMRLAASLQAGVAPAATGNSLADALLGARVLMEGNFGVEVVHVTLSGFDTHTNQIQAQEKLLGQLDAAIKTFLAGDATKNIAPMSAALAARTLVMTYSEFGRRIGENGATGTDHGAAAPMFLIGPAGGRLLPGLRTDHPTMGTTAAPADNLMLTTDMRRVYQSILTGWLGDPDPAYTSMEPLALFAS